MADNERLLESRLKRLESGCDTDRSTDAAAYQVIATQVALITALRDVAPPSREVDAARVRVRGRVLGAILAEDKGGGVGLASLQPERMRGAVSTTARVGKQHLLAAIAAMYLFTFLGSWVLSNAASAAAPNSPLYGLKRADEWLALHTAWSDQQRGEVYATIAWHRLTDAQFEFSRHNDRAAQQLTQEYDDAMRELIEVDADMEARHENTKTIAQWISRNLDRAYSLAQAARQSGDVTLAQALTATTAAEQDAIKRANITIPILYNHSPTGQPTNSVAPTHVRPPTPPTRGQETPTAGQPTVTPTPVDGNGGSGNGNGNGKGAHGH